VTKPQKVILIGMMGAGKSTTARLLAERLRWRYVDSDDEVERRAGRSIPDIWKESGESAFRADESLVLSDICQQVQPTVVSVGGGAVVDLENRATIRRAGLVVWLRAEVSTLARRVGSGDGRPLLAGGPRAALTQLAEARAAIYAELADLVFDVDRLSPPEVVEQIAEAVQSSGSPANA
jgi:shikimate kinase